MSRLYPCIYCTEDLHCTKYTDDNYESWCVLGPCKDEKPSNADKIRAMSDEELADILKCVPDYTDCPHGADDCRKCILDWLRQEAEE